MKKINMVKFVGLLGTGLGLAATLLSNYSQQSEMKKTVEEEVAKALAKKEQ